MREEDIMVQEEAEEMDNSGNSGSGLRTKRLARAGMSKRGDSTQGEKGLRKRWKGLIQELMPTC